MTLLDLAKEAFPGLFAVVVAVPLWKIAYRRYGERECKIFSFGTLVGVSMAAVVVLWFVQTVNNLPPDNFIAAHMVEPCWNYVKSRPIEEARHYLLGQ